MELGMYNSYLEVDFGKMKKSVEKVRAAAGDRGIICVLKANAYGIGMVAMADFLVNSMGISALAVAQTLEGVTLRQAGFRSPDIMLLGPAPVHAIPYAVENDLILPVFDRDTAKAVNDAAAALGRRAKVQIKIDTGMHRIGVRAGQQLDEFLDYFKTLPNLSLEGVFTHFVNATYCEDDQTLEAYGQFERAVGQIRKAGLEPRLIHCCNSGATSWFKGDKVSTHVRPGSLYMGYHSMDDGTNRLGVEECCSMRAQVTFVHPLRAGESCGYCNHFVAEHDMTIATVDVGYADGLFRPLVQNGGPVYVNDDRTRYLASSMDQTMIDVTGIDCRPGDPVTVFGFTPSGKSHLLLAELQPITGQNLSYPLCLLTNRVKRIYRY